MSALPDVLLTRLDFERLLRVVRGCGRDGPARALARVLASARVVRPEAVPRGVITMNSTFLLEDEERGECRQVTLSYPEDACEAWGRISVLSRTGCALLGQSPGRRVSVTTPLGDQLRLRVRGLRYQPEAAGHYHL